MSREVFLDVNENDEILEELSRRKAERIAATALDDFNFITSKNHKIGRDVAIVHSWFSNTYIEPAYRAHPVRALQAYAKRDSTPVKEKAILAPIAKIYEVSGNPLGHKLFVHAYELYDVLETLGSCQFSEEIERAATTFKKEQSSLPLSV